MITPFVLGEGGRPEGLFARLDAGQIVAPLTLASAYRRITQLAQWNNHPLVLAQLDTGRGGLVFFSSATTGEPKVVLHDYAALRARYANAPRARLRSISFLGVDHIGGFNTLLYGRSTGIAPAQCESRDPAVILRTVERERVQLLPVTPTFLRMMDPDRVPRCVQVISYGSERMDQPTLSRLCDALPWIDFRQMYGSSEIGILHTRSKARDSLWFGVDGADGTALDEHDGELWVKRPHAMVGYLNAPSPFLPDGWFRTGDIIDRLPGKEGWIRVIGRRDFVINCGGEKVLPSEIEDAAMLHASVARAKAFGIPNAVMGQAIEVVVQLRHGSPEATPDDMRRHFAEHLEARKRPHRIRVTTDQIKGKS